MPKKWTTEKFIVEAREVYGQLYGYNKVDYTGSLVHVIITCSIHGDFKQTPNNHLRGGGCSECAGKTQWTTEKFVKRSGEVHHGRYGYSKTVFEKTAEKVTITCSKHGDFQQTPTSHLRGSGCCRCTRSRTMTTKQFVDKAREVHGDRYNYDKAVYVSSAALVIITCPDHGDFKQSPGNHINSRRICPRCSRKAKLTTEQFVTRAYAAHKGRYTYEKTNYDGAHEHVIVTCSQHGDFKVRAGRHLGYTGKTGTGCPKCALTRGPGMSTEEFIKKAQVVHGSTYSYSRTEYMDSRDRLTITCSKHGNFLQRPFSHLGGRGCPSCNSSKGEAAIMDQLDRAGYKYETQKKFPGLGLMSYDFMVELPSGPLLLEFDGLQHFEKSFFSETDAKYEAARRRDVDKTIFALKAGIPLARFDDTTLKLGNLGDYLEEALQNPAALILSDAYRYRWIVEAVWDQLPDASIVSFGDSTPVAHSDWSPEGIALILSQWPDFDISRGHGDLLVEELWELVELTGKVDRCRSKDNRARLVQILIGVPPELERALTIVLPDHLDYILQAY